MVDPYSIEDITQGITAIIKDDKLRQKKIQLGLRRVKKFSWESCARETLEALERVAGAKR